MSHQPPTTPNKHRARLFLPPTSDQRSSTSFQLQTADARTATPDPRSENDMSDESPSSTLRRIQEKGPRRNFRPFNQEETRVAEANRLWPLLDPVERAHIDNMKQPLHSCLAKEGISSYSTTMAIHGTNHQTGTPKLILLTDEFLSPQQRRNIPSSIKYVNLRLRSVPASQDTPREKYKEKADPGTIIGAADRPNTSFSNGWWVRDCQTGSVFNLTAAHPLKAAPESTPFNWSVRNESSRSQTVDCPPVCAINAISLKLRPN